METVATGDVHAHHLRRTQLQDVLVAIRECTSLDGCERERRGNHEAVLLSADEVLERFPDDRDAVERAGELADRLRFDLTADLGYSYPDFADGEPASVKLRRVCDAAFAHRYRARDRRLLAPGSRAARRRAGADRRASGSTASSCSTTRCSSSPPTARARSAAATRLATCSPRDAGAEAPSARSSAT